MIKFTKTNPDGTTQTFESPSILDVISAGVKTPPSNQPEKDNQNRGAGK